MKMSASYVYTCIHAWQHRSVVNRKTAHNFYSRLKLMLLTKEEMPFCSALLDVDSCHSSDRSSYAAAQATRVKSSCSSVCCGLALMLD